MSVAAWLTKFFASEKADEADKYITLDHAGNARFDLANYLIKEGQARLEVMAAKTDPPANEEAA